MSRISDFLQEYQRIQVLARDSLMGVFTDFWEKNPAVNTVIWAQYTPYYLDGETCTFLINDIYFTNDPARSYEDAVNLHEGYVKEEEDESIWCVTEYDSGDLPEGVDQKSLKELSNFLTMSQMEPCMRSMFGEHSEVRATREGFIISHYEHE